MESSSKISKFFKFLKENLTLEALLVILIYVADRWSYNMYNAIQATNAINNLEIAVAVIGVIGSLYVISGMVFRLPSSRLMQKVSLRRLLVICFIIKIAIYALTAVLPVNNVILYAILRCIYALTWSFLGVALPAMLAIAVDNRLVGTAYALYAGLCGTLTAPSRPWAISLMGSIGAKAFYVIALCAIVPLVLSMFIRDDKFRSAMTAKLDSDGGGNKPKFKFMWKLVPLCLFASLPLMSWQMYNEFLPKLAEANGFSYLTELGIASAIEGWVNLGTGILCDIISPGLVAMVQCVLWAGALFLLATSSASSAMMLPFIMYGCGIGAIGCLKIACMKSVKKEAQVDLSGTFSLCNDSVTFIGSTTNGLLIAGVGYAAAFKTIAILPLITAAFCVYYFFIKKNYNK